MIELQIILPEHLEFQKHTIILHPDRHKKMKVFFMNWCWWLSNFHLKM